MKIALIPPVPELGKQPDTGIHLLLSDLADKYPEYVHYYRKRSEAGDYLILDNSAHEQGAGNSIVDLYHQARLLRAQEVVIPDVLFHAQSTVQRASKAFAWLLSTEGLRMTGEARYPRMMLVPQGDDRQDWAWCLKELARLHSEYSSKYFKATGIPVMQPVIGISKDYYFWRGSLSGLVRDFVRPLRKSLRYMDVHCLGWPTDLWSLAPVARDYPWVRSADSAKAHVYAKAGILLEPGGKIPEYPKRDPKYFDEALTDEQRSIAARNVAVFEAAATNELIGSEKRKKATA